jgi:radical SAM superfamily enzyme YgiQ (UPF0313 family)
MKRKVILFHPRIFRDRSAGTPLAPLALAAVLEQHGYDPIVIDEATEGDRCTSVVASHLGEALWFGISAISGDQIGYGLKMAECVRQASPRTPIVWGGRHASALPEQTVLDPRVDVVVRGEGETTVVELTQALEAGFALDHVHGITYKIEGQPVSTANAAYISDLDGLPHIPWHRFDLERYFEKRSNRSIGCQTGRGCLFSCSFCSHKVDAAETYRCHSPEWIMEGLDPLVRKHGIKSIELYEPFLVANSSRVAKFCSEILRRGLRVDWIGSARADNFWKLPGDLPALMKRAGCKSLTFGFESGSPSTLLRVDKRIVVEDIIKSVEACNRHGIAPEACFIGGLVGDSLADDFATLRLISHLRALCPRIIIHYQIYTAFPGSALYRDAVKTYGLARQRSLDAWGNYLAWKHDRPWLSPWRRSALRLASGSVYASDLDYLMESRKELRFRRPLHKLTSLGFSLLNRLTSGAPEPVAAPVQAVEESPVAMARSSR